MLLGNDVVDLREALPRAKERDARFLGRVFTPLERHCIQTAESPPLALWMLWAAKESLFKLVSKLELGTVFAHADFSLTRNQLARVSSSHSRGGEFALNAVHKHYCIDLRWEWTPEYVHCMAGWGCTGDWLGKVVLTEEIRDGFLSAREEDSVHSPDSRKVRLLAKHLLRERNALRNPEVVRMRETPSRFLPPLILENGRPALGMDLSLSHDGRFVAAIISV